MTTVKPEDTGVKPEDTTNFKELAEDFSRRAGRSRKKGFIHLCLIAALLLGTLGIWNYTRDIAKVDVEVSVGAAQALTQEQAESRSVEFSDIASCGDITIAVGQRGLIRVSDDDGTSWKDSSSGKWSDLNAVAFSGDCTVVIAVGEQGIVLVSTDDGGTWDAPETKTGNYFNAIALSNDGKAAIAVGDRGLFRVSGDGGRTWRNPGNITGKDVNDVALSSDGGTAVAVGDDNVIRISRDGGKKWDDGVVKVEKNDDFEAVGLGGDGKSAVAVGRKGTLLFSANVAAEDGDWKPAEKKIPSGEKDRSRFYDVALGGGGERAIAVAVGRRGAIWVSTNGGKSWVPRDSRQGNTLDAVALSDDGGIAVAVGDDGTVLVSTDGYKETWTFRDSGTKNRLDAIAFGADDKVLMILGENKTILRSEISEEEAAETIFQDMEMVQVKDDTRVKDDAAESPPSGETRSDETSGKIPSRISPDELAILFQNDFLRVGITLLFMFMAQHLFGLARYEFRLAAFYYARRDAILLTPADAFPRSRDIDELDQLMQALSPDNLEIGRQSGTIVDRTMQMMSGLVSGGRRRHGRQFDRQGAGAGRPDD